LFIAAIAIAVVVAAALFAPVRVEVSVEAGGKSAACVRARVSWLGLSIPGLSARRSSRGRRKPQRSRSPVRWASLRAALVSPGFVRRCARLVRDLGSLAVPDQLHLRAQVGFEDPADTGILLGWLYALGTPELAANRWTIQVEPRFTEPIVEGRLQLQWSRTIATIAWPLLTFVTSPAVWRAWNRARHASH
jgi:hypothetical protein